jgi:hypothetical protein
MQPQAGPTLWLRHQVIHMLTVIRLVSRHLSTVQVSCKAIMKSQGIPGSASLTRGLPTNFTRSPIRRSSYGLRINAVRAQATATAIENATATTTKHVSEPTVGKATPVKPAEYNYTKQMKPGNSHACGVIQQRLLLRCYGVKPPIVYLLAGCLQVLTE